MPAKSLDSDPSYFAHDSVYIDVSCHIGADTEILNFSRIMAHSSIGQRCRIGQNVIIPPTCVIGDRVEIGNSVSMAAGVVVEDDVVCGPSVIFAPAPDTDLEHAEPPAARVGHSAKIGANATIVRNRQLGNYCEVGADTVVTRDVPNYAIVHGNPMRLVGWACRCGEPMEIGTEVESIESTACVGCGRRYRKQGLRVEEFGAAAPLTVMKSSIQVPLLDLKPQFATIEKEVMAAIHDVCASQQFILGSQVAKLEQRIAHYTQCHSAIGVSSGTDALLISLMAAGIGPGDEVITTPYTFFATAGAIARVGARPVFCDIEPSTYGLSASAVAETIAAQYRLERRSLVNRATGGTLKSIIAVDLFGLCADMQGLSELAKRHQLLLIEDAAQALGAEDPSGRRAGSLGDIGCFSFFPSKNLGAFGDAGMCTTNDPALAERLRLLRNHGADKKYLHATVGGNFRLDELQAAVLEVKLNYLDQWTAARQANAGYYDAEFAQVDLDDQLSTPWSPPGHRHVYNQYVIRVKQRDELRKYLSEVGIGSAIYYPVPLHMQECFSHLGYRPEDFPEARNAAEETLALPIYPELTRAQKRHVVDSVVALLH